MVCVLAEVHVGTSRSKKQIPKVDRQAADTRQALDNLKNRLRIRDLSSSILILGAMFSLPI